MSVEQPLALSSPSEGFSMSSPSAPSVVSLETTSTSTYTAMTASPPPTHSYPTTPTTSSASAPEILSQISIAAAVAAVIPSPSLDTALAQSPRNASSDALLNFAETSNGSETNGNPQDVITDTDPQIIEALRSKDRLYVLKLGEMMEALINERRARIDLNPTTSYQRMLVHRCSSYYRLNPETDATTKCIYVHYLAESRIPARRISELVPAEESAQPTFKIMRRNASDRSSRVRHNSQPGSVAGDDADLSDVEPSEAGSIGGRSNATGSSNKRHLTIEQREAAYNEARSRIFMGFEEKEKEKDMSANSSTFSLVSGSGSTSGGRSSMGDMDDSASSAATESEWSGPVTRDKRDGRRGGGSAASSSRSYNPNGSGSSRNSRATSPSFTYPSLYEAPAASSSFDPTYGPQGPPHGYIQYYYPYPPPPAGQAPPHPQYMGQYPYYPPYGYSPPHQQTPHHSDPTTPAPGEMYPQQMTQQMGFQNPYAWPQPSAGHPPQPLQTSPTALNPNHSAPQLQHPTPTQTQPMPQTMGYGYMPQAPYGSYPHPMGYYTPPAPAFQPGGQPMHSGTPPHMQGQPYYPPPDGMQPMDPSVMSHPNGTGHSADNANHSRASSRNSNVHGGLNGNGRRNAPRIRQAWSYGPGAIGGGYNNYGGPGGVGGTDIVGPRLSTRRTSGTSSGSGSGGNRTPGDEASSTTSSSTTSSSSRRTFTSTSSKHPLPARPDWAVGLKPDPTLHPTRPHDHSNPHSRTMSPARIGGQAHLPPVHHQQQHHHHHHHHHQLPPQQEQQQPLLQATDFPPLSSASAPEKRPPAVAGAWTNTSSMRSILMPNPQGNANAGIPGNALVHYPNTNANVNPNSGVSGPHTRLDDQDRGFERPPPKGNVELFNPKGAMRKSQQLQPQQQQQPGSGGSSGTPPQGQMLVLQQDGNIMGMNNGGAITLAERLNGMTLEDQNRAGCIVNGLEISVSS